MVKKASHAAKSVAVALKTRASALMYGSALAKILFPFSPSRTVVSAPDSVATIRLPNAFRLLLLRRTLKDAVSRASAFRKKSV
jgi:threonine/homoserine efflux transporter RhtA